MKRGKNLESQRLVVFRSFQHLLNPGNYSETRVIITTGQSIHTCHEVNLLVQSGMSILGKMPHFLVYLTIVS